ncbi:MAG: hypothetical protein NVS2B3_17580 [Vulcanimicrobiaceae bacterium]
MRALLDLGAMTLKCAILAFVLVRFHASWVGLSVVLGMAILLFRLDRAMVRLATGAMGSRR